MSPAFTHTPSYPQVLSFFASLVRWWDKWWKGSFNFEESTWLIRWLVHRGEVRGVHIPVKSQSKHLHGKDYKFTCVSFLLEYRVIFNSTFPTTQHGYTLGLSSHQVRVSFKSVHYKMSTCIHTSATSNFLLAEEPGRIYLIYNVLFIQQWFTLCLRSFISLPTNLSHQITSHNSLGGRKVEFIRILLSIFSSLQRSWDVS